MATIKIINVKNDSELQKRFSILDGTEVVKAIKYISKAGSSMSYDREMSIMKVQKQLRNDGCIVLLNVNDKLIEAYETVTEQKNSF